MDIQLFDTELEMSPVDMSQIPKDEESKEAKEGLQEVKDDPTQEYTIIDVLDKPKEPEKKTEEVEESKEIEEKPAPEQSADSSKFPYSTFAKALYEEGVISFFEEDEFKKLTEETGSEVDALIESVRRTVIEANESWKNSLSPQGKDFLDALEKGVPLNKYIEAKSKEYSYASIKDEELADNDTLCKQLIADDLRLKGFDQTEIDDQIKDFDDLGKLEAKGKLALRRLKTVHAEAIQNEKIEAEKRNQAMIEANKRQLATLKSEIEKISEIIPGKKLNARLKGELYDAITSPAEHLESGQWVNAVYAKRAKDPIAWDIKVAYLDKLGVFDGKWDSILTGGKSAAVANLTEKLKSGSVTTTGEAVVPEATPKAKDILRSMEVFDKKNKQY